MKNIFAICIILITCSCSVSKMSSVSKKNMDILVEGAHRSAVIAEFGGPYEVKKLSNGGTEEYYKYETNALSGAGRAVTSVASTGLAVMTLGLSELVATPLADGAIDNEVLIVKYDKKGKIISFQQF